MESAKWQKIKEVISGALEIPAEKRDVFLASEPDQQIRSEVEKLLAAHEQADGFIARPLLIEQGIAEDEIKDSFIGTLIKDYLIIERIGAGGMGAVYLAEPVDSDFKQKVALKLVKRGMDSETILKRFARERRILSQLKHPNIAQLIDGGISSKGLPFFAMEFVEGLPLNQFCDARNLSLKQRLEIFRQICSAVDYAHKNLIIHRDLKPSNILVTADGVPKLLDFGIAKLLKDEESEITATQGKMFTPEYASPEQILGKNVTTAADVYSLGVVLYELLSGHRPFETRGKSFDEIIKSVCESEPLRPSDWMADEGDAVSDSEQAATIKNYTARSEVESNDKPNVPNPKFLRGDLDNIILKALRKEPPQRYGSVQQLSEDISRFLGGLPVLARPQTLKYRFGKYVKRHRVGVAAAALVIISLIGGISVATWQAIVAGRERARAEQRFNQVRKFANTVLFDYYERIREMPGATDVREKMVRDSLDYLDNLAHESDYSLDLQRELALAYRKVGDIQGGKASGGNLGQSRGSLGSYQKALAIQEKVIAANPANIEDRRLSARLMIDISHQLQDIGDSSSCEEYTRKAIAVFRQIADEQPAETKSHSDLARAFWTLADVVRTRGDIAGALDNYRLAADIYEKLAAEKPENRNFSRNTALTFKNMGGTLEQKGDFDAALELYQKAYVTDARNASEEPNNVQFQMDLSFSYGSLASVFQNLGKMESALENLQKKLAIQQKVSASDQKNAFAFSSLGKTYRQMGVFFQKLNEMPQAVTNYQKSIAIFRKLAETEPQNVDTREDICETVAKIAVVYSKTDKNNLAEEAFQESASGFKDLLEKVPSNYSIIKKYAEVRAEYGIFQMKNGRSDQALGNLRDALQLLESRSLKDETRELHASIFEAVADIQVSQNQKSEAVEMYRKSLEIRQDLLTAENTGKIGEIQKKLAKL